MIPGMSPPNIFASSPPRRGGSALAVTVHPLFSGDGTVPPGPFGAAQANGSSSPPGQGTPPAQGIPSGACTSTDPHSKCTGPWDHSACEQHHLPTGSCCCSCTKAGITTWTQIACPPGDELPDDDDDGPPPHKKTWDPGACRHYWLGQMPLKKFFSGVASTTEGNKRSIDFLDALKAGYLAHSSELGCEPGTLDVHRTLFNCYYKAPRSDMEDSGAPSIGGEVIVYEAYVYMPLDYERLTPEMKNDLVQDGMLECMSMYVAGCTMCSGLWKLPPEQVNPTGGKYP